ncbi:unnamed protein product [Closterium sp. NIES-54]
MEVARTSMIHATAPHFLWLLRSGTLHISSTSGPVSPCQRPRLHCIWTGKVGDASVFRAGAVVPLSAIIPWTSSPPVLFLASSLAFPLMRLAGSFTTPPRAVSPPLRTSRLTNSGAARSAVSGGAASGGTGAEHGGAEPKGTEPEGAELGGTESEGAECGGAEPRGSVSAEGPTGVALQELEALLLEALELEVLELLVLEVPELLLEQEELELETLELEALALEALELEELELETLALEALELEALALEALEVEALELETLELEVLALRVLELAILSRPASPVRAVCTGRCVPRPLPPPVPGTHVMALRPSFVPLRVPLPSPPVSSLLVVPDHESDLAHVASPTVPRLLATVVTDSSIESATASALVAEFVDFAATCRLDYATSLIAESESDRPLFVGGECALDTDVLEDKQEDFECLAAAVPHLVAMLLAPEGDLDAPDIPTPRSYADAITRPYSSQWQTAMDAEMASWKSTVTYVDAVPPSGAT